MASLDPNAPLSDDERSELEREFDDSPDSIVAELRGLDSGASADRVLTARIMEQVHERRVGRARRIADFLFGQRQLRFNVAVAAPRPASPYCWWRLPGCSGRSPVT